jgi:hypothetical protein
MVLDTDLLKQWLLGEFLEELEYSAHHRHDLL